VHLKPARRYRRDNGAVTRRDVHAATQRDREVRIIPADAGAIAAGFPSSPAGPGVLVAKGNMLVNVVADSLDAAPAEWRLHEQRPGGLGEPVALAISALVGSNTKASLIGQGDATDVRFPSVAAVSDEKDDRRLWVTGGKTRREYMFSGLPQIADIVRSALDIYEPTPTADRAFGRQAPPSVSPY
jgi:hypothetical protein